MPDADTIIAELGLRPHPQGGHYAETWRADTGAGQRPQLVVPAGDWQPAEPLAAWTLVGCTVSPGFRFEGFVLTAPDLEPGR